MAEQSPIGAKQVSDYLKQQRLANNSEPKKKELPVRGAIKRISKDEAPPTRGLVRQETTTAKSGTTSRPVRRVKKRAPATKATVGEAGKLKMRAPATKVAAGDSGKLKMRAPTTKVAAGGPGKLKKRAPITRAGAVETVGAGRLVTRVPIQTKDETGRIKTKSGTATNKEKQTPDDKPKIKIVTKTLPDGRVVKKRVIVKKVLKKKKVLTPEEQEKLRLEQEQKAKEAAEKKAEEERLRKEKEAEEERIRLEKEAEAKRLEEERIRLEREAELKRIEDERIRQEKERTRILNKIEACKGSLNDAEVQKAKKIAEEMVKRNIKWNGYISLNSGIGGSVLN